VAEHIYRLIEEKDQYFIEEKGTQKKIAATAEPLRQFARSGSLFFQEKKVIFDSFTKLQFILIITPSGEEFEIQGELRGPTQTLPLAKCRALFPGTPPCIFWGHLLQSLTQDIDVRFLNLPLRKTHEEVIAFLQELKTEGDDAPQVILPPHFATKVADETRPLLKLMDRSGAFANLYITYNRHGEVCLHNPSREAWRLLEEEKSWEKDLLETDFQAKIVDSTHYYCPMDKVVQSLTFLLEIGWKIFDFKGREIQRQADSSIEIEQRGSNLLFKGSVVYGEHKTDVQNVVGAFNRKERFIELSPNHVGLLDVERDPLSHLGEDVGLCEEGVLLSKSKIGLGLDLFRSCSIQPREEISTLLKKISLQELFSLSISPATAFQGELHGYQQEGLNWLHTLFTHKLGGLLADEMGLGKTVQVIAFLSTLMEQNSSDLAPILIVAPTSLLFHWRKECEKFFPTLSILIHTGPNRLASAHELKEKKVILTSYALLRLDSLLLNQLSYSAFILDEAQAIKNPSSQIAEVVCQIQADFRLAITGTPIENRHEDLWSIFHFLLPGLLGERSSFQAKMLAADSDKRYLHRMQKLLHPFILRRRKEIIADQLPDKIEQVIWVEMQEEQQKIYEEKLQAYKRGFVQKIREDSLVINRMEILEAILRLRQICCHPQLADASLTYAVEDSAKLQKLLEDLESIIAEGRKALIYSQFTSMLYLIEREVKERGWGYVLLEGATKDRETLVQKFQEDEATPLFLLSLKAGGVGLNLTAADYVLLFDPWWNNAVERQAIDRAHRLGRAEQVIARRYATAFSIEEKIMRLKEHKAILVNQLLEGDPASTELKLEELLELLD